MLLITGTSSTYSSASSLSIRRAVQYLHAAQTPEGGWIGNWGICFTYAAMFATESLALVGETYATSPYSKKACEFLISKQREDGGWGESYQVCRFPGPDATPTNGGRPSQSCEKNCWVEHKNTQVVQSCWAIMALMYAKYPHIEPLERGVRMVMDRQLLVSAFVHSSSLPLTSIRFV